MMTNRPAGTRHFHRVSEGFLICFKCQLLAVSSIELAFLCGDGKEVEESRRQALGTTRSWVPPGREGLEAVEMSITLVTCDLLHQNWVSVQASLTLHVGFSLENWEVHEQ